MTKVNNNIFRQDQQLLRDKQISEMTEEELTTVNAAQIPLDLRPEFNDMTTEEGLEALAKMIEGNGWRHPKEAVQKRKQAAGMLGTCNPN